ncbi:MULTISPECIES: ABC transporter permease subunit [unclassified Paenibacillus]|uniref:ABC transporter permease subunit n=1 Tax=unclassified Paenibacillus TaxID=185978 RepID=UPI001AE77433|nr:MULTISPECIES: ABC transporter permease subunit [unclassified Paenibacillus]MBP1157744.1 ABC-2 type transport system permease protein [Paenibacillus sp. PvP091]MBP1171520.1 ABC-2 type transport system permease protein [Paenibacillus sp. PvR098]MBP2442548.1 ABC-2 type transport system permease protein [Paenibacillus sp. PvP052]
MRRAWAMAKKELQMYFYSPTAYAAFAFFFLITGYFFSANFLYPPYIVDIRPVVGNITFVFLFIIPLLTMRLISDELRQGTDELLLTSPASLTEIVVGKYVAAMIVQLLLVIGSLIYPLILSAYGTLEIPALWLSYLSMFLMGAAMMAIGLFASSLTAHQMVSGIIAFAILLVFWTIEWLGDTVGGKIKDFLGMFSIVGRSLDLQKGVLDFADVLFYVTLSAVFVLLSIQVLERKRWR